MSVSEMESYRDLILENIEYDHLCREFTTYREDLDEIVELMVGDRLRQAGKPPGSLAATSPMRWSAPVF